MRDVMKTYRYAGIYWAEAQTKWGVIAATETDDGELPYIDKFQLKDIMVFDRIWHRVEPDWLRAWKDMLHLFERQGWMEEPIMGRHSGRSS